MSIKERGVQDPQNHAYQLISLSFYLPLPIVEKSAITRGGSAITGGGKNSRISVDIIIWEWSLRATAFNSSVRVTVTAVGRVRTHAK